VSKLDAPQVPKIQTRLSRLDAAVEPRECDVPGFYFHQLGGDRRGAYSLRVTGNWRITFRWSDTDAIDVDLEDYH
jgi:proteic killer suppression protein